LLKRYTGFKGLLCGLVYLVGHMRVWLEVSGLSRLRTPKDSQTYIEWKQ